ncbi:hypothetical protein [Nitrosomonas sp.]|uniref:hypothetical protein n=1 Tax=Nitrosomonas sp. TaxID=42353 RepID=UPI0028478578|nr:hypothetical protein [Nitrosomonas sp.]MDR4515483.1 hypothetical protein [Nitrosomonas sp.]
MQFLILTLAAMIVLLPENGWADIVVIVNPDSSIVKLSRRQIIDIYMGRNPGLESGQKIQPLDQPINSAVRAEFYRKLTGKPVSAINAYWARLLFTGRAFPPLLVEDNKAMLNTVLKNPNTVGYLESQYLTERVKVVYKLEKNE